MKTLPELKEIVENYKPSVIWSDGDWGLFSALVFISIDISDSFCRSTWYLLEFDRFSCLALQWKSCQRHSGKYLYLRCASLLIWSLRFCRLLMIDGVTAFHVNMEAFILVRIIIIQDILSLTNGKTVSRFVPIFLKTDSWYHNLNTDRQKFVGFSSFSYAQWLSYYWRIVERSSHHCQVVTGK